jgi:hypothetical protein
VGRLLSCVIRMGGMTSESSEPDEQVEADLDIAWHREMDRIVAEWDDEPTHEKWRKGGRWT